MINLPDFDFDSLLSLVANDPSEAAVKLRAATEYEEAGYQRQLRERIAVAYAIAAQLRRSGKQREKFLQLPFLKSQKRKPRLGKHVGQTLLIVMKVIFQGEQSADRCQKYAAALRPHLEDDVDAREIPDLIEKEGGIDKMYSKAVALEKAKGLTKKAGKEPSNGNDAEQNTNTDGEKLNERTQANDEGLKQKKRVGKRSAGGLDIFEVQLTRERLHRLLAIPKGGKAEMVVEHTGTDENGWHWFVSNWVKPK